MALTANNPPNPAPITTTFGLWLDCILIVWVNRSVKPGLLHDKVQGLRVKDGFNIPAGISTKIPCKILLDQYKETIVVYWSLLAVISALLGDWKDAIVILIIVAQNAILGYVQEYHAEWAMQALTRMTAPIFSV